MPVEKQPWDGVERRRDDAHNVGITSLKIATRAVEGNPLDVGQMFHDTGSPTENHIRPADFKNLKLRGKVESLLRIAIIDDVEIAQFVGELVDTQYQDSLDTLKLGENPLYDPDQLKEDDVPVPPTLAQAKEILAAQVTIEQLEVIKKMEIPILQLIPPSTRMARYVEALNGFKPMDGQIDAYVSPWHQGAFSRADARDGIIEGNDESMKGWRIAVTEGSKEPKLLEGDDVNKTLRERGAWFKQEFGKKGVSGVDLKRMIVLMMHSLKEGNPVSDYWNKDGTWTFVNEEPENNGSVSGVRWSASRRQVRLGERGADDRRDDARFRASVMVDVPRS